MQLYQLFTKLEETDIQIISKTLTYSNNRRSKILNLKTFKCFYDV